jgi:hypothetical protein
VPTSDVAGIYTDQIGDALNLLHIGTGVAGNGLNDDLTGVNLPVCRHPSDLDVGDECVRQAAPFIIPDVLTIDTTAAAGFPNGRQLEDRVMDIILALVLLDVDDAQLDPTPDPDPNGVPLTVLFDLDPATEGDQPLNPAANDVDFLADFPYVAPPHEP